MTLLFDYGPFNERGLGLHQADNARIAFRLRLLRLIQLSPCRPTTVQQGFTAELIQPVVKPCGLDTITTKVMELMLDSLLFEPFACLPDFVAIGYAVNGNHDPVISFLLSMLDFSVKCRTYGLLQSFNQQRILQRTVLLIGNKKNILNIFAQCGNFGVVERNVLVDEDIGHFGK